MSDDIEFDELQAQLKAAQETETDLSTMALSQLILRTALVGDDLNGMQKTQQNELNMMKTEDPDLYEQINTILLGQAKRLQALMTEIDRRFPVETK